MPAERRLPNPDRTPGALRTEVRRLPLPDSEFSLERTTIYGGIVQSTSAREISKYEVKQVDPKTQKTTTDTYTVTTEGKWKGEVSVDDESGFGVTLDEVGYFKTEGDTTVLVLEKLVPARRFR